MKKRRGRGEGSVDQLPSGAWRATTPSRTVGGKKLRASQTFKTKPEAVAWLTAQIASGKQPASGTLGNWLQVWLERHKESTGESNFRTDKGIVDKYILPGLGSVKLATLDRRRIKDYLSSLTGTAATRHVIGRTLRKALFAAVDAGQLAVSPMDRVKIPKRNSSEARAFTREELAEFLAAADRAKFGTLALLWVDSGIRPSELLGLQWGDYDQARGTIAIRRSVDRHTGKLKAPKTDRSRRTIPLSEATRAALATLPQGEPETPMFGAGTYHKKKITHWRYRVFMRNIWKKIKLQLPAKLQEWAIPYTTRHTCASLLLQAGVSLRTVSERLGHTDVALTLRVYAHVMPGDQEKAARIMGELLLTPKLTDDVSPCQPS